MSVDLHPTRCAICGTLENGTEIYPATFSPSHLNAVIFSARRLPDRIHFRIVRCNNCGLVRSDPVADTTLLHRLYAEATFDYGTEVANLQATYGHYLRKLEQQGVKKGVLLEVGCGNGFVLEEALRQGYERVVGVEPTAQAIEQASDKVKSSIVCDMMRPGLFAEGEFDAICMFQVFDHISDPTTLLEECRRVLKPGGMVLIFNHNVTSVSARLLKEASPIIDIEHTYLYSSSTLKKLLRKCAFEPVASGSAWNRYSLRYLARLVPMPNTLKSSLLRLLQNSAVGDFTLTVPLGNLWVIASKT